MNNFAVECRELTKCFGTFTAVDHISFTVKPGEIFGMLGPNGSGKSTTIRMLCGIMDPTFGQATVAGKDIRTEPDAVKELIGYMSQKFSLYPDLTAFENLRFYAGIYGIPKEHQAERIAEVMESTGLSGQENTLAGNLSTGVRQRLALGSAIIHNPKIIFLDEPTSGADPVSRRRFWNLIYDITDSGATVIVTTHYMDEAERCDSVLLIESGKIIACGSPDSLKKERISGQILSIDTNQPTEAMEVSATLPGVEDVALYGRYVHIFTKEGIAVSGRIRDALQKAGIKLLSIEVVPPTLEDVFVRLIGGKE
ncbi:MAG TPA: multidrug ABC transporter ATP-binding protein [Armatimonadetes bacterium]|nr:multidrug ABC transporter ATP-binding protein [Armatimonadota bacterium]